MKTCLRAVLDNGQPGRLLDLSFVADDHQFGVSPDGSEIHIEGHGEFTVSRGTPYAGTPPEPPAVNGVPFSDVIVHEDGHVRRRVPSGVNFRTVTEDDSPEAFRLAASETLFRDALWKNPPPLDLNCGHDLCLLPVIEFRQTIACARCGGLAVEASAELTANPAAFTVGEDGRVSRKG